MKKITIVICLAVALFPLSCLSHGDKHTHDHDHDHDHDHELVDDHDHDHDHAHEHETEVEDAHEHTDEILFTHEQAEAAGLTLETVTPGTFRQVIKTSGQVLSSQGDETTVVATANGMVSFVKQSIAPGAAIRAGETMVTLSAATLPEGDPVAKLRINYETALKEYQRAEALVKEQIISQKEFDQIRANYETARTAYEAQESVHGTGGVRVTSPTGGFIKNLFVSQGDFVSVGQPIATVAQNRKLQLRAEVSVNNYKNLRAVESANFKMAYDDHLYKLSDMNGRLLSFGKSLTEQSQFVPVSFEFNNVGDILPGSFAEIYLLSAPLENVISVPLKAITEEQGLHFVYLQVHEDSYKKQEVTVGPNDGERVQILTGLRKGNKVVVSGVYQVKLAATSSVIPEGHSHAH